MFFIQICSLSIYFIYFPSLFLQKIRPIIWCLLDLFPIKIVAYNFLSTITYWNLFTSIFFYPFWKKNFKIPTFLNHFKSLKYEEIKMIYSSLFLVYLHKLHRSARFCCWKAMGRFRSNFWRRIQIWNQNQPIMSAFWDIWG